MTGQSFELIADIVVEDDKWPQNLDPIADKALAETLRHVPEGLAGPAEISILLTNDQAQQALNAQWRQQDKPTNVLSFPSNEPFAPIMGFIGDISMARETLEREALELDKDFTQHFTHLLIHGFLHCLGYDHETDDDAAVMEGLETHILSHLGITNPYEENYEPLSKELKD